MGDSESNGDDLNDGGRYDERDEYGVGLGRNDTARIIVETWLSVIRVVRSRHDCPIDEIPEEFTEEKAPYPCPYRVDRGKDANKLGPLMPDKDSHSRFIERNVTARVWPGCVYENGVLA